MTTDHAPKLMAIDTEDGPGVVEEVIEALDALSDRAAVLRLALDGLRFNSFTDLHHKNLSPLDFSVVADELSRLSGALMVQVNELETRVLTK